MVQLLMHFLVISSAVIGLYESSPKGVKIRFSRLTNGFNFHSRELSSRNVEQKYRYSKYGICTINQPPFPYITIAGIEDVNYNAVDKACTIVSSMTKHMSKAVFKSIARGFGVALFPIAKGMGVYPENQQMMDTPECKGSCDGPCGITCTFDGRKWNTVPGMTSTRSYAPAENVLCTIDDPEKGRGNILVHEFGHQVHGYMPARYQQKIERLYNKSKSNPLWGRWCYGAQNAQEHWAVATEAFFMTSTYSGYMSPICGMNECDFKALCTDERQSRKWLKKHDAQLYSLLSAVYTHNKPRKESGLKTCI